MDDWCGSGIVSGVGVMSLDGHSEVVVFVWQLPHIIA